MNNQNTIEHHADALFREMREEKAPKTQETPKDAGKFEVLPDGNYVGRVFIQANTISNENSPNYGRKKYEIQLTVTEGNLKGKMAYHHRVIMPHYLANKPADSETVELERWRKDVKEYMKKTDEILENCGVDTSDTDMERFTAKIAENNRRSPFVNFTMKNGNPYINHLVKKEQSANAGALFADQGLPNGDDAPLN